MTLETTTHKSSPVLGFKGGTAAYLFYGLERFSTDLDFDLLSSDKEDFIFETINNILARYGTIKKARKKRYNIFFLLSREEGQELFLPLALFRH
jgi:predicted nucleotidyltransferase component of viral defense system